VQGLVYIYKNREETGRTFDASISAVKTGSENDPKTTSNAKYLRGRKPQKAVARS
jgi:hypothetical protein